ncbi:MAG: LptF/LptG family permease [bacterium]
MQTLKPLIVITICVTAVIWLTQVLQQVDFMVEDGASLSAFLKVIILLTPNLLAIITPFTLFASTLFVLNRLKMDSEIDIMRASGAGSLQLSVPLIFLALIGTAFTYYMNIDLMPRSYRVLKETVREVRSDIAKSLIRSGQFTPVTDNLIVYADTVKPGGQYLGMLIYDRRKPEEPLTYMAESGLYKNTIFGPRLHLINGNVQSFDRETEKVEIVSFTETAVDLTAYQKQADNTAREETERYIGELLHPNLDHAYDQKRYGVLIAEGHSRLSTPLYNILYVLIASIALLRGSVSRVGYSRRILLAVLLVVVIRVLGFVVENAASRTAILNYLQYAVPISGIIATLIMLIGPINTRIPKRKPRIKIKQIGHPS